MSNEGKKEELTIEQQLKVLLKEKDALSKEQVENLRAQNRLNEAYFEDLKRQETIIMQLAKEKATALTEEGKLQKQKIDDLKVQIKLSTEEVAFLTTAADGQAALIELHKQRKKLREEEAEMTRDIERSVGGLATKIGIGNSSLTKSVIKYREMAKNIAKSEKLQKKLGNSIKQTFSAGNILGRIVENTIALAFAVDKAAAAFASATGTGREFEFQIGILNKSSINSMVAFDKAQASLLSVNQELIGGAQMSKDMQREIAEQTMGFSRFGIEAATVTKIMNDMQTSMGMTAEQSIEATKSLSLSATQLGIGPKKMAEGFLKASSVLAVHGNKSISIFKGLAVAAKNAGTSVDSLISIASKFDTFSSAADAAGKLNAILGSTMSATEMLMMTEDERIETLIKTVNSQGRAFKDMDRFEQKAIAQAAGINDMAEANRIFGMSLSSYKQQQKDADRAADVQQKFADAMEATLPIQERFTFLLQQMAADGRFVAAISKLMTTGLKVFEIVTRILGSTVGQVILIFAAFRHGLAMTGLLGPLIKGISALGKTFLKTGVESEIGGNQVAKNGPKVAGGASVAVGPILALGAAALGLGVGIGAAAAGMGYFVQSLKDVSSGKIIIGLIMFGAVLGGLVYLMVSIAPATLTAAGAVAILGLAAMSVGASFMMAGIGIEKMVNSIGRIGTAASGFSVVIDKIYELKEALDTLSGDREIKFKTTLQNLALITSGRAAGMTTAAAGVQDLQQRIQNEIQNNFEIVLKIGEEELTTIIESVRYADE